MAMRIKLWWAMVGCLYINKLKDRFEKELTGMLESAKKLNNTPK